MQELRRAVAIRYGCTCVHVASAPVKETFHKEMAWDGEVEVFDFMGHRTTKKCNTWFYTVENGDKQYTSVLGIFPIDFPERAVKAAVARNQ